MVWVARIWVFPFSKSIKVIKKPNFVSKIAPTPSFFKNGSVHRAEQEPSSTRGIILGLLSSPHLPYRFFFSSPSSVVSFSQFRNLLLLLISSRKILRFFVFRTSLDLSFIFFLFIGIVTVLELKNKYLLTIYLVSNQNLFPSLSSFFFPIGTGL